MQIRAFQPENEIEVHEILLRRPFIASSMQFIALKPENEVEVHEILFN